MRPDPAGQPLPRYPVAVHAPPMDLAAHGTDPWVGPTLGARLDLAGQRVTFQVFSRHATRVEVYLYEKAMGADEGVRYVLAQDPGTGVWYAQVSLEEVRLAGIT